MRKVLLAAILVVASGFGAAAGAEETRNDPEARPRIFLAVRRGIAFDGKRKRRPERAGVIMPKGFVSEDRLHKSPWLLTTEFSLPDGGA